MTRILYYAHNHIVRQKASQETKPSLQRTRCHVLCSHNVWQVEIFLSVLFASISPLINILSGLNLLCALVKMNSDKRVIMALLRPLQESPIEGGGCKCYNKWWYNYLYGQMQLKRQLTVFSPHCTKNFVFTFNLWGQASYSEHITTTARKQQAFPSIAPYFHILYIKLCSHGTEIDIFMFYKNTTAKWQKCHN